MKGQRVFLINAAGIAHSDADLSDSPQTFFDQSFMSVVEGLKSTQEQRRRRFGIKKWMQLFVDFLRPEGRRTLGERPEYQNGLAFQTSCCCQQGGSSGFARASERR